MPTPLALIRHDLATLLARHHRVCALAMLDLADSSDTWRLIAEECEGLGAHRDGTIRASVAVRVCERLARGEVDAALTLLAEECGLSVDEWCAETRREMSRATVAA